MIKERSLAIISVISIFLVAMILMVSMKNMTNSNDIDSANIKQPDYVSKIFNKNKVSEINIKIDEEQWTDLLQNAIKEEYYNCDITINGETFSNVGIRAKGNSSLNMVASDDTTDRYSFKIKFDKYIKGQDYYGLEKLALNNNIGDTTNMKEYLSYEIFDELGVAVPGFAYTNIKINGQEWGLYLAVEVMEESFIERQFGSLEGNLYKPETMEMGNMNRNMERQPEKNNEDIVEHKNDTKNPRSFGDFNRGNSDTNLVYTGDDISNYSGIFHNSIFKTTNEDDYNVVVEMMKNLDAGTNLEEYLDVDEILRYFAANTFLVNLDSYAGNLKHNYYLYERNGKFQILPWDFNLSFGGHEINNGSLAINFPIDNPVTDTMENSPLISKLLEKQEYKEIYYQYLEDLTINYIESGKYKTSISRVNELIKDYIKSDPTAFYTYEEYQNSLPILLQFGKDRAESVMAQLKGQQPTTTYGDIKTNIDLSALGSMGKGAGNNMMNSDKMTPPGNFGNGENPDTMFKAMEIIRELSGEELTDEDRRQLAELGLNSEQIEELLKMIKQMPNNMRDKTNRNMSQQGTKNRNNMEYENNIDTKKLIIFIASIVALILSLIFISNFKRKKYIRPL